MNKVPKARSPGAQLLPVSGERAELALSGERGHHMPGGDGQSMPNGDRGVEPEESSWQGGAGKGVPGTPGSDFRGEAAAGEQAQPGLWRLLDGEWGAGSSQEHLGVQGRDGVGVGWKTASGLSMSFC